jgi:hypothetical protein
MWEKPTSASASHKMGDFSKSGNVLYDLGRCVRGRTPIPNSACGHTGQRMIERLDMQLRLPNSSRRNGIIIVLRRESGYLRGAVNPFPLGY